MTQGPFKIRNKMELKNAAGDTYKATLQNATLSADATVTIPDFATNTLASVNNAQTFTGLQILTSPQLAAVTDTPYNTYFNTYASMFVPASAATDLYGGFRIGSNTYNGNAAYQPARQSGTSGAQITFLNRTSDANPCYYIQTNLKADSATTNAVTVLAGYPTGSMTFGRAAASSTAVFTFHGKTGTLAGSTPMMTLHHDEAPTSAVQLNFGLDGTTNAFMYVAATGVGQGPGFRFGSFTTDVGGYDYLGNWGRGTATVAGTHTDHGYVSQNGGGTSASTTGNHPYLARKKLIATWPANTSSSGAIAHGLTAARIKAAYGKITITSGSSIFSIPGPVSSVVVLLTWNDTNIYANSVDWAGAAANLAAADKTVEIIIDYESA